MTTVFTKIINGELPSAKVYEDDLVYAFMDVAQLHPDHVLVVTKKPYETLMDADEESAAAMMRAACRIAKAVQAAFKPDGINILQSNKVAAWQTVPHRHLHVSPRYHNDSLKLSWSRTEPGIDKLREYAAQLKL